MFEKSQRHSFTFFGTMRLTGNFKKFSKKNSEFFFSFFSFLRAFVVSSCRKNGFRFRVFLSLRYGADLGRSRLVYFNIAEISSAKTIDSNFFSEAMMLMSHSLIGVVVMTFLLFPLEALSAVRMVAKEICL